MDWVGMKAAFNAAFNAQVMHGQPGHPMPVGADMIFTKSIKHLKAFNDVDHAIRLIENITFNQAIMSAPFLTTPEQAHETLAETIQCKR